MNFRDFLRLFVVDLAVSDRIRLIECAAEVISFNLDGAAHFKKS